MRKLTNVVMLATEKADGYCILKTGDGKLTYHGDRFFTQDYLKSTDRTSHHLYLIEIEEITDPNDKYPEIVVEQLTTGEWILWQVDNPNDIDRKNQRRIIATTDKSLTVSGDKNWQIAQIPESFSKVYIGNSDIKQVAVECNTATTSSLDFYEEGRNTLIKTRADNTVIIHQAKVYTREDVELLIERYREYAWINGLTIHDKDQWVAKNL